tara:strand:+ start:34 stop:456 length:423 start_codon:yes stop_codon:yes gene_type:complete
MKKLFLSILVICSLLGGNAYAENIEVICKFISGQHLSADNKVIKFESYDGVAKDVVVKLDTKRKKLLGDYPHSDNATILWEEDFIQWWPKRNSKISNTSFELNRHSGQLIQQTYTNNSGSSRVDGSTYIKFNCSKSNKIF